MCIELKSPTQSYLNCYLTVQLGQFKKESAYIVMEHNNMENNVIFWKISLTGYKFGEFLIMNCESEIHTTIVFKVFICTTFTYM